MKVILKLSILVLAFGMLPFNSQARERKEKVIYAFGYSTNLNDTTYYLSPIQVLPGATLTSKEKFLVNRNAYSTQLKEHLESTVPGHEACAIFFSKKKKSLEKKYAKLRNHLLKLKHTKLTELKAEEFQFKAVEVH